MLLWEFTYMFLVVTMQSCPLSWDCGGFYSWNSYQLWLPQYNSCSYTHQVWTAGDFTLKSHLSCSQRSPLPKRFFCETDDLIDRRSRTECNIRDENVGSCNDSVNSMNCLVCPALQNKSLHLGPLVNHTLWP